MATVRWLPLALVPKLDLTNKQETCPVERKKTFFFQSIKLSGSKASPNIHFFQAVYTTAPNPKSIPFSCGRGTMLQSPPSKVSPQVTTEPFPRRAANARCEATISWTSWRKKRLKNGWPQQDPCIVYIYLELQTTSFLWLFQLESLHKKWLYHQTSIKKWLFRVPRIYIYTSFFHPWPFDHPNGGHVFTPERVN